MAVQGFPQEWLQNAFNAGSLLTSPQLHDLGGNAFSANVFAACYLSLLASLPAKSQPSSSSEGLATLVEFMAAE